MSCIRSSSINKFSFFSSALFVFLLSGCAPTSLGQQYKDGELNSGFTPVVQVNSNQPRHFIEFAEQSRLVLDNSPSLAKLYASLYDVLNEWASDSGDPNQLVDYGVQLAQLSGGDSKGNVLFTGYFSPVIRLSKTPNETFFVPVYALPECIEQCPTREQIYQGALVGQGLELGYAANYIDPFIMEIQGSGFVHFVEDEAQELHYFAYAGKNNHPYVSIGRLLIEQGEIPREKMSLAAIKHWVMNNDESKVQSLLVQNSSYVFFQPKAAAPVTGSAGIPLIALGAVAADTHLFPLGTPLLAEVPLLNADGTWSGVHQLRLLIALDTGGAVKQNHLDLYHGIGAQAGVAAGHYKHFGRVWKLGLADSPTQAPWALPPEKQE